MNDTPERFLPIAGYEGRYEIGDQGHVRSWVYWSRSPSPRILKPALSLGRGRYPYLAVILTDENGKRTRRLVHHLVARTFLGPQPEGLWIRHLNGISVDNRLDNFAYGTPLENTADAIRHGTQYAVCVLAKITHCKWGHEFTEANTYIKFQRGKPRRGCHACDADRAREYRRLNPEHVRAIDRASKARNKKKAEEAA